MKKWAAAIATLGFIGVMGTLYAGNISPTGVMNKAYGKYNARFKCWIVKGGQLNHPHCMKPIALQQVSIGGKQIKFLLASGDEIDLTTDASGDLGMHVSGGLIGMFVYTGPDNSPRIIAQEPKKELGTYGNAPEGKFVKLGPDRYGWQFENGNTGQGYTDSWLQFYSLEKHGMSQYVIQNLGSIPIYHDDSGAQEDESLVTMYEGKASIIESNARDGFYPIHVNMNRQIKGKQLEPITYEVRYSFGKGKFALPAGYPLDEP